MGSLSHATSREAALIADLSQRFGPPPEEVILGIGDDCAAIRGHGGDVLLWTVDTLVEGVHFDLDYTPLEKLGWKALAVNLSDIAAMGGEPRHALLSLGWPPRRDRAGALALADGLARAARQYGVAIIGGDTVASPGGLALTLTLTGTVPASLMLKRSGARVGDLVWVTGVLGDSAAGLEVLKRGLTLDLTLRETLVEAHLAPRPQLAAGRLLAREGLATALIDVSDGIATDLAHLCLASAVGARLRAESVPISGALRAAAALLGRDPLQYALSGGEDYQLLFTSPPELASALENAFVRAGLPAPRPLGEIIAGQGVLMVTAAGEQDISMQGYDHFRLDLPGEAI
jgi:thiamine-monophosphate kinase